MTKSIYKYRIYGRNKGRKKIQSMDYNFVNNYILNPNIDIKKNKRVILDIGSGNGENSLLLSKTNTDSLIIACEIFIDGHINLSRQLFKLKLNNVKLFSFNVLRLFDQLKEDKYFDEIWILFPDPWEKNRHHKRRLINNNFFNLVYPFIKNEGKIFIATDSKSYLNSIIKSMYDIQLKFRWENDKPQNWFYEQQDLAHTKYFKKARNSYKSSFFIQLIKI